MSIIKDIQKLLAEEHNDEYSGYHHYDLYQDFTQRIAEH